MANVILTAAGAAVGGPVGGAIGSFLGRQIDRSLNGTAMARISDLRFPSSQYGDAIPAIAGRMRVAGIILWAAEPVAIATVSKSGTSQGSSVSFAYGLSSGRIERVSRIWADGRLIRDGDGRQEVAFGLRLHQGDEDQDIDPLIASVLGEENTPAYRGIAYLVFEDFDLSSFGNRIPMLTVEVLNNDQPLTTEDIIRDRLLGNAEGQGDQHFLTGYAFSGDSLANAISPILEAYRPSFALRQGRWCLDRDPAHHVLPDEVWPTETVANEASSVAGGGSQPTKVSLRFFDSSLDYSGGEKSARLPGSERLLRIELPAAMTGEDAKAAAVEQLLKNIGDTDQLWLELPQSFYHIQLGDFVTSSHSPAAYHVTKKIRSERQLKVCLKKKTGTAFKGPIEPVQTLRVTSL